MLSTTKSRGILFNLSPELPRFCRSRRPLAATALSWQATRWRIRRRRKWVAGDDAFGMSPSLRDGLAALVSRAAVKWTTAAEESCTTGTMRKD